MVLLLDPDIPLLWRTPQSAQLGALRVVARLDAVGRVEERLIQALRGGADPAALAVVAEQAGGSAADADEMLRRLGPAVLSTAPGGAAAPGPGSAPGSRSVPDRDGSRPARRRERAALFGELPFGAELASALHERDLLARPGRAGDARLAVVLAAWIVPPAVAGHWLRRDVPHLPIVLADDTLVIGPLVQPGASACLHCVHRHRVDDDPAWPALAAQLLDRPAPRMDGLSRALALAHAGRIVASTLVDESRMRGVELRVDLRDGAISERTWMPHPECRCAARPGSGWAHDDAPGPECRRTPAMPTSSARAVAAPA
ncbi:TOMM precursor leader peptide-binding protein [Schumannella sp. 10F1B-5-1]|nr:TOMM precursor leader peptide-binding protein [Schumannella sp. 10F1B-5-1]